MIDSQHIQLEDMQNVIQFEGFADLIRYATTFRYFKVHHLHEIVRYKEGLKMCN